MDRRLDLSVLIDGLIADWEVRGYQPESIRRLERELRRFQEWFVDGGLHQLTSAAVAAHILELEFTRKRVWALRALGRYALRSGAYAVDPARDLRRPREQGVRSVPMTVEQVEAVLTSIPVKTRLGLRNRALLETAYSTGLRRSELIGLRMLDVDMGRGVLLVREGKGSKDRWVPIGARALGWVDRWLVEGRPGLSRDEDPDVLFVSRTGRRLSPSSVNLIFEKVARKAGVPPARSPHAWRHAAATHLLEGGASVRHVQAFLGHEDVQTTVGYTHVGRTQLRSAHADYHPFSES